METFYIIEVEESRYWKGHLKNYDSTKSVLSATRFNSNELDLAKEWCNALVNICQDEKNEFKPRIKKLDISYELFDI